MTVHKHPETRLVNGKVVPWEDTPSVPRPEGPDGLAPIEDSAGPQTFDPNSINLNEEPEGTDEETGDEEEETTPDE